MSSGTSSGTSSGQDGPDAYDFAPYLDGLGDDWWADDALLRRWVARSRPDQARVDWLARLGQLAAGPERERAERAERPESLPRIAARGPYNRECEEIWLPPETRAALARVHGSGLWRADLDERARYAAVYLLNQNGEAGITCSVACTDGLARSLRTFPDDPRSRAVIERLEAATPESWVHGAQFVTEVQGGSDAATNAVRAVPAAGDYWSLEGQKWFCSNLTADYWLVTARFPDGAPDHRGVGLFCVPRRIEGRPNGHHILRLKDKLGTRALPTAELELRGALGWPVGPLSSGLRNMVAIVLTTSRIHNVVAAAAFARRAAREARAYTRFRSAFGRTLDEHPLVTESLEELEATADRTAAGAFATVDAWADALAHPADPDRTLWARIWVSVAKAVTTRRIPGHVYRAMMLFGGNGIEERFCALPRLWRDAAILETWEGPYTLLLMNALGDLIRLGVKGRERTFLEQSPSGSLAREPEWIEALGAVLADPGSPARIREWGQLAPRLYARFETAALESLQET